MQTFTSGDVTLQVEISNMKPHVGPMSGYYCEFVWWLSIDGVEYVSGETAFAEDWHIESADGREGWDAESVSGRIDGLDDAPIDDDIDAVVERVLDWFANLREDIVGAWFGIVEERIENANQHGDNRPDLQYGVQFIGVDQFKGQPAWAVIDSLGRDVGGQWYDSKEQAEIAAAQMQDA